MMNDISDSQALENRSTGGRLVPLRHSVPTTPGGYGRYGEYPATSPEASALGANLFEYWRILKKRKWIILSVLAALAERDGDDLRLIDAPLVEGAVAAAVMASTGASLDEVAAAAEEARGARKL